MPLTLEHDLCQRAVGRIAIGDQAVQNQIRAAAGHTDFMAVKLFTTILDDDVGVRLEDRKDFFGSRYLFPGDHPSLGLRDDLFGQIAVVPQLPGNGKQFECGAVRVDPADCPETVAKRISGNLEKVPVTGVALPLFAGILDADHPALCPPAMIFKDDAF